MAADQPGTGDDGASRSPVPPDVALDQCFDGEALAALRGSVAVGAASLGLPAARVDALVVVAHELASNSVRHGGGSGRLRLWRDGTALVCEVSDAGPGMSDPQRRGRDRPDPSFTGGGRGIYFVRQLADEVYIASDGTGTTVTVRLS